MAIFREKKVTVDCTTEYCPRKMKNDGANKEDIIACLTYRINLPAD